MASPYQFKPYAAINPRIDNDSYAVTASSISELLHSGDYSDLQIICRDEVYNVHRAIVCPRSKVIETKLKRWHFHDSQIAQFDMSEHNPRTVREFICYLYNADYDHTCPDSTIPESSLLMDERPQSTQLDLWGDYIANERSPCGLAEHRSGEDDSPKTTFEKLHMNFANALVLNTEMYILADKYDVPALKLLATAKFETAAIWGLNSSKFCEAVELLWENTTDNDVMLRNIVTNLALTNIDTLANKEEFIALMPQNGSFCLALLNAAARALKATSHTRLL